MKMWIRKRLDISTKDLIYAIRCCLMIGSQTSVIKQIERIYEKSDQKSLICFSVRTGFDLLFETLKFEDGDEVIMSALTIPDMPKIIKAHGLIPIPLDLNMDSLGPTLVDLEAAITPKTKAIVVAHLFGGIIDLDQLIAFAKAHHLLVIEDCAQAFYSKDYSGNSNADISMFSFGTIKTATALGGGVLVIRKNNLLADQLQNRYRSFPIQRRFEYFLKVIKYLIVNYLSTPRVFPSVIRYLERKGIDHDAYIHNLSRSFPNGNFYEKIRRQPCLPLLKLLLYRLKTYDFARIETRVTKGNYLLQNLPESLKFPGQKAIIQTHWAFPVLCSEPHLLIARLKKEGFDATNKISLIPVASAENDLKRLLNVPVFQKGLVFLPLYAEIPFSELNKMVKCLEEFQLNTQH